MSGNPFRGIGRSPFRIIQKLAVGKELRYCGDLPSSFAIHECVQGNVGEDIGDMPGNIKDVGGPNLRMTSFELTIRINVSKRYGIKRAHQTNLFEQIYARSMTLQVLG